MLEPFIDSLRRSGWNVRMLTGNWVCATDDTLRRGLLLGLVQELPPDLTSEIREFNIPTWDAIVFCPGGVDSSHLKNDRLPGIQCWYWDLRQGNLFPYPPSKKQEIPNLLRQIASGSPISLTPEARSRKLPIPYLTYSLLGINLLVFLLMTLAGGSENQGVLVAFGAKVDSLIQAGQVWRLFTSMFLHIGFIHLAFNLYSLWVLGPLTEQSYGHFKYALLYILSGIGAAFASYLFSPALSAGASGAIFGLLGAQLLYSYKRPELWKSGLVMNLLVVIFVNLGMGYFQPEIDNYAHIGGLLTGIVISFILTMVDLKPNSSKVT